MIKNSKKKDLVISVLLGIYLSFATSPIEWNVINYILFFVKICFFSYLINIGLNFFSKLSFKGKEEKLTRRNYICIFLYIMFIMSVAIFIYYPSNFTVDMNNQYEQVMSGKYNDWHPIIHTIIFYRLPTLFIESKFMCSLFQMIFIDLILLYFCYFLNKYGFGKKSILFVISLFILNPSFDFMAISPLKDVAFSYCLFLATLFFIDIYMSEGKWLKSRINFFLFLLVSFGITFFRHNGIFSFLVMMIVLIMGYKNIRKKSLCIFFIILSLRFVFIPTIYNIKGIHKTNVTISEMVCVMLNQMLYIYDNGGKITNSQMKQLEYFQDLEKVSEYYNPYDYNKIKYPMDYHKVYSYRINTEPRKFFTLYKDMVMSNKKLAIKSYAYTMYCLYHIGLDTTDNNSTLYWIAYRGNYYNDVQEGFFAYKKSISNWFFSIFLVTVSTGLFYIIFSLFYCLLYSKNKFKEKIRIILPYIPVLSNFILMLFLLPGKETRFIYSNILCAYPLILLLILLNKKINKSSKEIIK